jgi:hypothetical protein
VSVAAAPPGPAGQAGATPQPAEGCPLCGSPLQGEQEWCLRCGAAARTRLASTPNWRAPLVLLGLMIVLGLGVLAAALVSLAGGSGSTPATTITRTVTTTSITPTTPGATTTPTTPGATVPTTPTTPGASTPGATTPTGATPGGTAPGSGLTGTTPGTTPGATKTPGTATTPGTANSGGAANPGAATAPHTKTQGATTVTTPSGRTITTPPGVTIPSILLPHQKK